MMGRAIEVRAEVLDRLRRIGHTLSEVTYGMTIFDWVRGLRRERADVEHLFILVTIGDMLGLPILPPYYSLRLLPYCVPLINTWKRRMLREKDLTDLTELIEGVG